MLWTELRYFINSILLVLRMCVWRMRECRPNLKRILHAVITLSFTWSRRRKNRYMARDFISPSCKLFNYGKIYAHICTHPHQRNQHKNHTTNGKQSKYSHSNYIYIHWAERKSKWKRVIHVTSIRRFSK